MSYLRIVFLSLCGIVVSLLFCACGSPSLPQIEKVTDLHLEGLTVCVGAQVYNPNPRKLVLSQASATLWLDGTELADIALRDPLKMPRKKTTLVEGKIDLTFRSPSDEFRFMLAALSLGSHTVELEVRARGRYGLVPFSKKIKRAPYKQVFRELGLPESATSLLDLNSNDR